jgi:site-specific recombinase XerD
MELAQLNEEFLSYLEVECNRSLATIAAYASDFRLFRRFVGPRPLAPEDVDRKFVRQYITWLRAEGHQPNSITRRLASLRSLWKYLRDNGYAETDPFLRVSIPKRERPLPTWLTVEECERLLAAAERQPSVTHAYRDRAVLGLLLFCGLRKAELLALEVASVDLSEGTVRVERGKGGKCRVLPMPLRLVSALADWLELRPLCQHERLFTSSANAPLGGKGLASVLRRSLHRAGITKRCTLHHLRHSFACLLLQGGCDLYSLSQMLGHARLDTTATYLHASARDLHRAAAKHPLAGGEQRLLQQGDGSHLAGHVRPRVLHGHVARAVPHQFGDGALVNVRPDQEGVEGDAAGVNDVPAVGKARVA